MNQEHNSLTVFWFSCIAQQSTVIVPVFQKIIVQYIIGFLVLRAKGPVPYDITLPLLPSMCHLPLRSQKPLKIYCSNYAQMFLRVLSVPKNLIVKFLPVSLLGHKLLLICINYIALGQSRLGF